VVEGIAGEERDADESRAVVGSGATARPVGGSGCDMQCIRPFRLESYEITVPCGKCVACKIARSREWATRAVHEMGYHQKSVFATYTYDEDHLPADGQLKKDEFRGMMKRLRKQKEKDRVRIKYYVCGEYGEQNKRPHYHAIMFGVGPEDKDILEKAWGKGFVHVGLVSYDSVRYCADYLHKKSSKEMREFINGKAQPFQLTSKGFGKQYCLDNASQIVENLDITVNGVHVGLPRYYVKQLDIEVERRAEEAKKREKAKQKKPRKKN